MTYLEQLKAFTADANSEEAGSDVIRKKLIEYSDKLIGRLNWNEETAREYLIKTTERNSRRTLTLDELLSFNKSLNKQIIQSSSL